MVRKELAAVALVALVMCAQTMTAESDSQRVKKAVERSTLDQAGTKPFHLKAEFAPSRRQDADSGRSGEVEIRWVGPDR